MNFIEKYNSYQSFGAQFSEERKEELIDSYDSIYFNGLLESFRNLDKTDKFSMIQIDNFFTFIKLLKDNEKLNEKEQWKIVYEIYSSINEDNFDNYQVSWRYLSLLLISFREKFDVNDAKRLFDMVSIKDEWWSKWIRYFREKDERDYFDKAIRLELSHKDEEQDYRHFGISAPDIEYILADQNSFKKFAELLHKDVGLMIDLFYQRADTYRSGEILSPEGAVICDSISNNNYISIFEQMIVDIMSFDPRKIKNRHLRSRQDDLQRSHFLHEMGRLLVVRNNKFFWKVLNLYDQKNRYFYWAAMDFVVYSILPEHIEDLIKVSFIEDWIFLQIYYAVARSDREDKEEVIGVMKKHKGKLIEDNDKQNELQQKKEKERIDKKNSEIRDEIEDLINILSENKTLMSERLLYLYEQNEDLFLPDESQIIVDQIDKILTSKKTYNPEFVQVKINKDDKNNFTRSQYLSNNTIDRCILLGQKLGINMSQYQDRLVRFLPFLFDGGVEKIIEVLWPLTQEQTRSLIDIYLWKREDDLQWLHSHRIMYIYEKWLMSQWLEKWSDLLEDFIQILQWLVDWDNNRIWLHTKKEAIKTLWDLSDKISKLVGVDEVYFKDKFDSLLTWRLKTANYYNDILVSNELFDEQDRNNFELVLEYNTLLIAKYQNQDAIERRLDQIINIDKKLYVKTPQWSFGVTPLLWEFMRWTNNNIILPPLTQIIKYPDHKDVIFQILTLSFNLKQEENEVVSYLQWFIAKYYKTSKDIDETLLELKENIGNTQHWISFLKWYLFRDLEWSSEKIEKFLLKDQNKKLNKNLLKIKDLKYKISVLEESLFRRDIDLKQLGWEFDKYKNQEIILTEWKTDWKHLCRAAEELMRLKPKFSNSYEAFMSDVKKIDFDLWDKIYEFSENLAKLYYDKKIIIVVDSDVQKVCDFSGTAKSGYTKVTNNIFKKDWITNLTYLILPHPTSKALYLQKWSCIEMYYDKECLEKWFIVYRDLKLKNCHMPHFSYASHTLIAKTKKEDMKLIYDASCKIDFFFTKKDMKSFRPSSSKEDFATKIYEKDISLSIDDRVWKRFDKIFKLFRLVIDKDI